jgi:hypothetical protein
MLTAISMKKVVLYMYSKYDETAKAALELLERSGWNVIVIERRDVSEPILSTGRQEYRGLREIERFVLE